MKILPNTIVFLHSIQSKYWLNSIFETIKNSYNIVPTIELERYYYDQVSLTNACHLTFDDGDVSFYNHAFPLIKKYKIPVSIYVSPLIAEEQKNFWFQEIISYRGDKLIEVTNKILPNKNRIIDSKSIIPFLKSLKLEVIWEIIRLYQKETNTPPKPPMNMTIGQLKELKSSGLVDIGAHTLNHPILQNETDETAYKEIIKSIDDLSDILNSEIRYFAYPNGRFGLDFGRREMDILKNKGIKMAFSTNKEKISHNNDLFCIPRSGSPLVSENKNIIANIYLKWLTQLLVGEKLYYKFTKK